MASLAFVKMPTPSKARRPWALLAAVCLALATPCDGLAAPARKTHAEMVRAAVDAHIIPRLEKFHGATERLATAVEALCASPGGADHRRQVEERLAEVVSQWGAIDLVRFGPVMEASRLERLFFWPDPRAVTERQLQALLARRDPKLLETAALASESVAVQGLGALEFIVTDDKVAFGGSGEDAHYRCRLAAAIAANLVTIARDVATGWTAPEGWRTKLLEPRPESAIYKDHSEAAREVVKSLLTGLQIVQDRYVAPLLEAAAASPPRRTRLPFERSGLTARYLEQELRSLGALLDATGLADYVPDDKRWMAEFIPRSLKSLAAEAATFSQPPRGATRDEAEQTKLRKMRFELNGLRQIINRELAPAAGLVLGFNELDGD